MQVGAYVKDYLRQSEQARLTLAFPRTTLPSLRSVLLAPALLTTGSTHIAPAR